MQIYRIYSSTLQLFETRFLDIPRFIPNLLRFRRNPNICRGVYEDDSLLGTFILQPYTNIQKIRKVKILRIERPLVTPDLSNIKRVQVFDSIKKYVEALAISLSYDFIEMELYELIDDEIFFPSSLSTVGSFNFPQDQIYLTDDSFDEMKSLICYEMINGETLSPKNTKKNWFKRWKKKFDRWTYLTSKSNNDNFSYLKSAIPFFAFNFPEYILIKKRFKSKRIYWFPNLFLLSQNNWHSFRGNTAKMRKQIMKITEGKIYRLSGLRTEEFLSEIQDFWKMYPFSTLKKIQIFVDEKDLNLFRNYNGRLVHRLRLYRKSLR